MNKKFIRISLILISITLIAGICGCTKFSVRFSAGGNEFASYEYTMRNEESSDIETYNVSFANYTQEEKISYVVDYLSTQYGVSAEVSEVIKRQINSFSSEKYYYTIAKCSDNSIIYCWIDDYGKIWDSKFINDLEVPITHLFSTKISDKLHNYIVISSCTLNSPTEKTWSEDEVEEMLSTEDITVSIYVFIDEDEKETTKNEVDSKFDNAFSFVSGRCCIYYIDEPESIQDIDLANYDLSFDI